MRDLAAGTTFVQADGQLSCDLDGEVAILDMRSQTYFGLNPVGAYVWDLLTQPRSSAELLEALGRRYEASTEQLEADLQKLLRELQDRGLVTAAEPAAAS